MNYSKNSSSSKRKKQVFKDAGKVKHEVALKLAEKGYEKFRVVQDRNFVSDFDKGIKQLSQKDK